MATVDIYKGQTKLGSGVATLGSPTITGVARVQERTSPSVRRRISNWSSVEPTPVAFAGLGRNVTLVITQVGIQLGRTWAAKVIADTGTEGTTLTLDRPCPYT